jgi:hypothetical protein
VTVYSPQVKELRLSNIWSGTPTPTNSAHTAAATTAVAQGLNKAGASTQQAVNAADAGAPAIVVQRFAETASDGAQQAEQAAAVLPTNHPAQEAVPLAHANAAQAHHETATSHAAESAKAAATGDAQAAVASSQSAVNSAAAVAGHSEAAAAPPQPIPTPFPNISPNQTPNLSQTSAVPLPDTPVTEVTEPLRQAENMLTEQGQPAAAAQVAQNARTIVY